MGAFYGGLQPSSSGGGTDALEPTGAWRLRLPTRLSLLALLLAGALVTGGMIVFDGTAVPPAVRVAPAGAGQALGLPVFFEANEGQVDGVVDFVARGPGYTLFVTPAEAVLSLGDSDADLRMRIVGGNRDAGAEGVTPLPGKVNYMRGDDPAGWHTDIATFGAVAYRNVYPGIDMIYRGEGSTLQYDFEIAPGADPETIALDFHGATDVMVARNGDLVVTTPAGDLRQSAPYLFQESDGRREEVSGRFVVRGNEVGFAVGSYDRTRPLVIDPTLTYGTYFGASGFDITFGIAVDGEGSAYVAGHTSSANFPTLGSVPCPGPTPEPTPPPSSSFQCDQKDHDAFIAKLNPQGTGLVYSTYLGGHRFDQAWDIALDRDGNAYVVGATESADDPGTDAKETAFPSTGNAFDKTCGTDGFCDAPLASPGSCTVQGGCPTVPLADAFMAKLSADGSDLLYATFLGGSDIDQDVQVSALPSEMAIAVKGRKAYAVGSTASPDFPTTSNAAQKRCGVDKNPVCDDGALDGFLTVINTSKSGRASLRYSTYIGGSGTEEAKGVGVDLAGNAYVGGTTLGFPGRRNEDVVRNNFPTKNAFQPSYGGGASDAFVVKINPGAPTGSKSLRYGTYVGGGGTDLGWDLDVQAPVAKKKRNKGRAFITGFTDSGDDPSTAAADGLKPYFPTTPGAFDRSYNGLHTKPDGSTLFLSGDAFVTKIKPSGRALGYSTFLGGDAMEVAGGIAVSRGFAYVTGYLTCDNQDEAGPPCKNTFPVVDALFPEMDGSFIAPDITNIPTDSFATKLTRDGSGLVYSTFLPGDHFDRGFGIAVRATDADGNRIPSEAYMVGRTNSSDWRVTPGAFQTEHNGGGRDGYVTKITD